MATVPKKYTDHDLIRALHDREVPLVTWAWQDVQSLHPKWSKKRCEEELAGVLPHLNDRLVELGWEVLGDLLPVS